MLMALSGKVHDQNLLVVDGFKMEEPKTKHLAVILKTLSGKLGERKNPPRTLLIIPSQESKIQRAIGNLEFAKALSAKSLNIVDLLAHQIILLTKEAIPVIEETYKT